MSFKGFNETLPNERAVGSPSLNATKAWENSCAQNENISAIIYAKINAMISKNGNPEPTSW